MLEYVLDNTTLMWSNLPPELRLLILQHRTELLRQQHAEIQKLVKTLEDQVKQRLKIGFTNLKEFIVMRDSFYRKLEIVDEAVYTSLLCCE